MRTGWVVVLVSGTLGWPLGCRFPELPEIVEDAGDPDGAVVCVPDTTTCSDSLLVVCDTSGMASVSTCGFGCAPSRDRCLDLDPANGLAVQLDQAAAAAPLVLTGNATIDTTAGTVLDGDGSSVTVRSAVVGSILAISVRSMSAANVRVTGSRSLAILSDGDVMLTGVFSASAEGMVNGPGAIDTAICALGTAVADSSGGGGGAGGGFGTAGGDGGRGNARMGAVGGAMNGDSSLVPLRGGCRGGLPFANFAWDPVYRASGGGGGAIQLSTRGTVTIGPGAFLAANGGGAKSYVEPGIYSCQEAAGAARVCHTGAGGGAGGALLIEAASISIAPSGGLVANGGAGHCGSHGSAPDGANSETPATGTTCSTSGAGSGGNGGAATLPATAGSNGTTYGGGGGGGAGRIRVSLPPAGSFDQGPPIVSPPAVTGTVSLR